MPESKSRRRPTKVPAEVPVSQVQKPNAAWFVPVMVTLMLLGLAWIITYYISDGAFPIPDIGNWNIGIGFGIALAGFMMTTRWRS
ncbi:cell division protein CrgA [Specibacter sp. NPDC057265]|uniref:cell division protein CrgA n=1 Tax=Specibacter sp. NPDC057265 TaxID=3346075 RepID=UPI00362E0FED